jgi:hypothetical protein
LLILGAYLDGELMSNISPKCLFWIQLQVLLLLLNLTASKVLPVEIFDMQGAMEIKSTEMNLQNFVNSLESVEFTEQDIFQVVLTKGKEQGILKEILDICLNKVSKAKEELR